MKKQNKLTEIDKNNLIWLCMVLSLVAILIILCIQRDKLEKENEQLNKYLDYYQVHETSTCSCKVINKVTNVFFDAKSNIYIGGNSYIENYTDWNCEELF